MLDRMWVLGLAVALMAASWTPAEAQVSLPRGPEIPMHPQYSTDQPVSPVFEGWYENPDGTYTLSFGYFNRNSEETIEIPVGPNNNIEPARFNGMQPTTFLAEEEQGYTGRGWGVFAVVVPEDWTPDQDVVWTLTNKNRTYSVPGRIGIEAYRLTNVDNPMAVGSMPPALRFSQDGREGLGPKGIVANEVITTSVGTPVELSVWTADRWDPEIREIVPVEVRFFKHQGPVGGAVTFSTGTDDVEVPGAGGTASTMATFSAPGEYVIRIRTANFDSRDSRLHDHCCWTNGYQTVTVTP